MIIIKIWRKIVDKYKWLISEEEHRQLISEMSYMIGDKNNKICELEKKLARVIRERDFSNNQLDKFQGGFCIKYWRKPFEHGFVTEVSFDMDLLLTYRYIHSFSSFVDEFGEMVKRKVINDMRNDCIKGEFKKHFEKEIGPCFLE